MAAGRSIRYNHHLPTAQAVPPSAGHVACGEARQVVGYGVVLHRLAMTPRRLRQYAQIAAQAAVAAGSRIARFASRPRSVQTKRSPVDLVTELDRSSEQLLYRLLHRAEPAMGFLGEEYGLRHPDAPLRWIVDPIDGTNNFVHGLPLFGVSIGLQELGQTSSPYHGHRREASDPSLRRVSRRSRAPVQGSLDRAPLIHVGVIYDPMRRELFTAMKGLGAFLNGKRVHVSTTTRLAHSLLSTGFSSNFLKQRQPYLDWFETLQRHSHGVRRIGSTVISLSAVAAGRLDGFYELDLWPWDMAAGMLLVEEAGGRVTDLVGQPARLEPGGLLASNGAIHQELLHRLAQKAVHSR